MHVLNKLSFAEILEGKDRTEQGWTYFQARNRKWF